MSIVPTLLWLDMGNFLLFSDCNENYLFNNGMPSSWVVTLSAMRQILLLSEQQLLKKSRGCENNFMNRNSMEELRAGSRHKSNNPLAVLSHPPPALPQIIIIILCFRCGKSFIMFRSFSIIILSSRHSHHPWRRGGLKSRLELEILSENFCFVVSLAWKARGEMEFSPENSLATRELWARKFSLSLLPSTSSCLDQKATEDSFISSFSVGSVGVFEAAGAAFYGLHGCFSVELEVFPRRERSLKVKIKAGKPWKTPKMCWVIKNLPIEGFVRRCESAVKHLWALISCHKNTSQPGKFPYRRDKLEKRQGARRGEEWIIIREVQVKWSYTKVRWSDGSALCGKRKKSEKSRGGNSC